MKKAVPGVHGFTFDFAGSTAEKEEVTILGKQGKSSMLKSLTKRKLTGDNALKKWLGESAETSTQRKYYTFGNFEPLIDFQPHVVHLLNVQRYDRYKELLKFLNVPFVVSFRGFDTSVRPYVDETYRHMIQEVYQKASRLQFVSDFLAGEAVALGAPRDKCHTIYRSIDLNDFSANSSERISANNRPVFLSVCRLTWQKGLEYALQAMGELKKQGLDFKYRIIGNGDEKNKLVYLSRLFDVEDRVIFAGHKNHTGLKQEMLSADIMLQPSVSEAMPNTLIEASALKLPIVAAQAGGIPEIVYDGETGLLVPPADASALASAIKTLLDAPEKGRLLADNARAMVEDKFSPEKECSNYVEFYEKALTDGKERGQ
ncbi:glycosyltransferase family 4 protein [Roseivirga sp. BDSF3-8]|uniref:glycosyltransferase family 4 protein n=1 Tax=Roseivirga sp. BDSF3-8 TaxID=3241598 RepID=UPI0035327D5E